MEYLYTIVNVKDYVGGELRMVFNVTYDGIVEFFADRIWDTIVWFDFYEMEKEDKESFFELSAEDAINQLYEVICDKLHSNDVYSKYAGSAGETYPRIIYAKEDGTIDELTFNNEVLMRNVANRVYDSMVESKNKLLDLE